MSGCERPGCVNPKDVHAWVDAYLQQCQQLQIGATPEHSAAYANRMLGALVTRDAILRLIARAER